MSSGGSVDLSLLFSVNGGMKMLLAMAVVSLATVSWLLNAVL